MKRAFSLITGTALLVLAACSGNQETPGNSGSASSPAEAKAEGGAPPEGSEIGNGLDDLSTDSLNANAAGAAPANGAEAANAVQ